MVADKPLTPAVVLARLLQHTEEELAALDRKYNHADPATWRSLTAPFERAFERGRLQELEYVRDRIVDGLAQRRRLPPPAKLHWSGERGAMAYCVGLNIAIARRGRPLITTHDLGEVTCDRCLKKYAEESALREMRSAQERGER